MNEHLHHAESALRRANDEQDHAATFIAIAGVHATLALAYEIATLRGAESESPARPASRSPSDVAARERLEGAREDWGRSSPLAPRSPAVLTRAIDDAIGLLGGAPF